MLFAFKDKGSSQQALSLAQFTNKRAPETKFTPGVIEY